MQRPCITISHYVPFSERFEDLQTENQVLVSRSVVNINTASAEELEKLPNIGAKTAQEIINHREEFGRFRKTEHLMLVRGISDKRFREIKYLIKAE